MQYRGEVENGYPSGIGEEYRRDGTLLFKGRFEEGLLHGEASIFRSDGETLLYKGEV